MSLGKVLRATFSNWCQQTSIAGLNNIANSKSNIKKIYWFILFCVGCYITVNSLGIIHKPRGQLRGKGVLAK